MKGLKPCQQALSLIWAELHILIYILNHRSISIFTLLYLWGSGSNFRTSETSGCRRVSKQPVAGWAKFKLDHFHPKMSFKCSRSVVSQKLSPVVPPLRESVRRWVTNKPTLLSSHIHIREAGGLPVLAHQFHMNRPEVSRSRSFLSFIIRAMKCCFIIFILGLNVRRHWQERK